MNKDKLIEIYESGNHELCLELMEGVGLDYLNLELPEGLFDSAAEFKCISGLVINLFSPGGRTICHVDFDNNLHEVSFDDELGVYEGHEKVYINILKDLNLSHLAKYLKVDNVGKWCLGLIPYDDVMRIVFAKSNKNENSIEN